MKRITPLFLVFGLLLCSCSESSEQPVGPEPPEPDPQTAGCVGIYPVPSATFDWERADWMPTPPGQSRISNPWMGAGALNYEIDVLNDCKASAGWVLLYSTFDANASAPLENPYFILYNKYRGIMRIVLYVTTPIRVSPTGYFEESLSVPSGSGTSVLNFMGDDIIDGNAKPVAQTRIHSNEIQGLSTLAYNKWYWFQYELAYDPAVVDLPQEEARFDWRLTYYHLDGVSLGGPGQIFLNGVIGAATEGPGVSLVNLFRTEGEGAYSAIGHWGVVKFAEKGDTGKNRLGMADDVFKKLVADLNAAAESSPADFADGDISILNGVFGGSGDRTLPVNLTLRTPLQLNGPAVSSGPSSRGAALMQLPGASAPESGLVPLYDKPLGVCNISGRPPLELTCRTLKGKKTTYALDMPAQLADYSAYLVINPAVAEIADVTVAKQDLVVREKGSSAVRINPTQSYEGESLPELEFSVRFTLKVTPKDGAPTSVIVKTFLLDDHWNYVNQ